MHSYLVQGYIDRSAGSFPEKVAVTCEGSGTTFGQLLECSNRLANCLKASGVRRQDRVAFCLKRSPRCVVAIEGILKADAIYVPLDPKSPASRWRKILHDCQPAAVVCDAPTLERVVDVLQTLQGSTILALANRQSVRPSSTRHIVWQEDIDVHDRSTPEYRNIDTDIAYIIYTSGSTGTPKGVMVSHLNIMNYVDWAVDYLALAERDTILGTAPFHFDMSTFDVHCSMRVGATFCIASDGCLLFPNKLYDLIEREGVTVWKAVSSSLMYLSTTGSLKAGRIPTLRDIMFGGEVLATKHLKRWMETYPEKSFHNVYGPTEATGISTCHRIDKVPLREAETIPIGKACGNTEVFLLREDDSPVPVGEIGEICIRGSGVSCGYWEDRDETKRAFVQNPMSGNAGDRIYRTGDLGRLRGDGVFEFVGRKDMQVKVMGYRIELSEIETAIVGLDNVNDAAVILSASANSEAKELVAFVVVDVGVGPDDILAGLSSGLPQYMVPRRIVPLKSLPRTDRGKVDRVLLGQMAAEHFDGPGPGRSMS